MDENTISTGMSPELFLHDVKGDLAVKGWDRPEIQYRAEAEDATVEEKEDRIQISSQGDLSLRLPEGASIKAGQLYGDSRFKNLVGPISIEQSMGSIAFRSVSEIKASRISGDLIAKQVKGSIQVEKVNGNVHIRECLGDCVLRSVNGNLDVQAADGTIQADVDGNARLRLPVLGAGPHKIQADGNIQVEVLPEANVSLHISCEGEFIRVRLPGESKVYRQDSLDLTLGDGSIKMELVASGSVSLSTLESGWAGTDEEGEPSFFYELPPDFGERISRQVEAQIEAQMETMTRQMNDQMARMTDAFTRKGMSQEEAEQMMEETRRKSAQAAVIAEEKMRRAQEKMERKMESHRKRTEAQAQAAERRAQSSSRRGWHFSWSAPTPPTPPAGKGQASEEERLMILKMLEQKKISLDEAANLLEALEGKGS